MPEDYREEVHTAMQKAIARAWSDDQYKSELIADPHQALGDLGVHYPDHYKLEFFDDPSAKVGDWSTVGKGQTAVLRVPIPPAPASGSVSEEELAAIGGGNDVYCCCCTGLCTCSGAISLETWN